LSSINQELFTFSVRPSYSLNLIVESPSYDFEIPLIRDTGHAVVRFYKKNEEGELESWIMDPSRGCCGIVMKESEYLRNYGFVPIENSSERLFMHILQLNTKN